MSVTLFCRVLFFLPGIFICMTGYAAFTQNTGKGVVWGGNGGFESKEDDQIRSMGEQFESLLEAGDYIVYRYFGAHFKEEVILTEEIIGKTGLRLTIRVTARRGGQTKTWHQVVIDSLENRKSNAVEELYQIIDGEKKVLPGDTEKILLSLYEWVLPPRGEVKGSSTVIAEDIPLPDGGAVPGECTLGSQIVQGRTAHTRHCTSLHFPWYHISFTMRFAENSEVLFAMTISDWGP